MITATKTCLFIAEVILRRAEAKLKLSKTIMEDSELASGMTTTIETKTQVIDKALDGLSHAESF